MAKESALMAEYPTFHANEKKYTLRPLGLGDVVKVTRLLAKAANKTGNKTYKTNQAMILDMILQAVEMDDEIFEVLADVMGVTVEDIKDPYKFPIDSAIDMFEAFSKHPDLQRFFTKLQAMTESNEALQTLQKKVDGASKN